MNGPTKTVREKAWKLSSAVQYQTYTSATDTTGKQFFLDFIICRFLAVFLVVVLCPRWAWFV